MWNVADAGGTCFAAVFESIGKLGGAFTGKGDGERLRSGAGRGVAVWGSDGNVACRMRARGRRRRGEMWVLGLAGAFAVRTGAASDDVNA